MVMPKLRSIAVERITNKVSFHGVFPVLDVPVVVVEVVEVVGAGEVVEVVEVFQLLIEDVEIEIGKARLCQGIQFSLLRLFLEPPLN